MKTQLQKFLIAFLIFNFQFLIKANAQIIYTDVIPDQTFNTNGSVYHLDLNNDSIIDFDIAIQKGNTSAPKCSGLKPYASVIITPVAGNFVATTSTSPTALIAGDTINNTNTWSSGILYMARDYWACIGTKLNKHWQHYTVGQWLNATDRYLGLKFTSGGQTFYGWARLNANANSGAANFTIKDYAYYAVPNQTILAGQSCAVSAILSVNGSTSLCKAESTTLSITPGYFYLWSNGETNSVITVSPSASTNFTVLVTDTAINCTTVFSQLIISNSPVKTVHILNCDSIVSEAITPTTYQWLDCANMQPVPGATQKGFHPSISGGYSVIVSLNGCVDTSVCNYVVAKNLSVIGNTSVCHNDSVLLVASGGSSYLWSTGETTAGITVSPQITTLFSVAVIDSNNCTAILKQLIISNNPVKTVNTLNCNSIVSNAIAPTTYQWLDCVNMQSILGETQKAFQPTVSGSYSVRVSLNGCVDTSVCNYVVPKSLSIIGNTSICHGDSVTLSVTPGYFYLWSNGATNSDITVSPLITTNYSVLVTDTSINCTSVFSQLISVPVNVTDTGVSSICHTLVSGAMFPSTIQWYDCSSWQPVIGATQQTFIPTSNGDYAAIISNVGCLDTTLCYNVDAISISTSGNSSICLGESASISASPGYNYVWSTGETNNTIIVSPNFTTNFTVAVSDTALGCTIILSQQIIVNVPILTMNTTYCDSLVSNAISPATYQWLDCTNMQTIPGATENGFRPSVAGNYAVIVSLNGCVDTSACINFIPKNLTVIGNSLICRGDSVTLVASGGTNYTWNTGTITNTITVSPLQSFNYTVLIFDSIMGCTAPLSQTIFVNPLTATISQTNDSLIASGGDSTSTYQWIDCTNNLPISGANSSVFIPQTIGNYAAIIFSNGCTDTSNCIAITTGIAENYSFNHLSVYPNPATNSVTIKIPFDEKGEIQIINPVGVIVETHCNVSLHDAEIKIDVSKFPAGMYVVRWLCEEKNQAQKFSVIH